MTEPMFFQAYVPDVQLPTLIPFLLPLVGAILCLMVDAASNKQQSRAFLPWIAGVTLFATILSFFFGLVPTGLFAENTFKADEFGVLACVIFLFGALVTTVMAPDLIERRNIPSGEFYTLILFSAAGGSLLSISNELLTAFVALEIMSLSLYVLCGIDRKSSKSAEASFKYFILGSFASAFLVLGIGFLFGATHTTFLSEMVPVLKQGFVSVQVPGEFSPTEIPVNPVWVYIGFALLFVGMCFKLSLAPFHMWAPDVYEGANTPTVLLIATGSKVAAFAMLVHVVDTLSHWRMFEVAATFIIGLVAVASMLWGNLGALVQTNFKRMMAYSSVAQTGYMALALLVLVSITNSLEGEALVTAQRSIRDAIVLYLAGYTIMSALAFGIAWLIGGEGHMAGYRGLVFRNPVAATGMAVAMFSLVGIGFTPPTIGFMGKYYLFKEAVNHGYTVLAVVAVLTSVISAFYYLNLVVTMFMREESEKAGVRLACMREQSFNPLSSDAATRIVLGACCAMIFVFGLFPGLFLSLADKIQLGMFN